MKYAFATALTLSTLAVQAQVITGVKHGPQLLCHRTADEDVPENTLESLDQAALLGCDVVEIDLRRTFDDKIVLNHDGYLDRLTDGAGEVEQSLYGDLALRDAGSWMAPRFAGMHMVLFEDALRLARERGIRLILDMKTPGMGAEVFAILQREGMLERVQFNAEWSEIKKLYPGATDAGAGAVWVSPGVTALQVQAHHREGKAVIANFSANEHEMDFASMKAAVAAGVDGINVDYPRLGADAVGRPVEATLRALVTQANTGAGSDRIAAILRLAHYNGFPLQPEFQRWLSDPDAHISRAAAVALVQQRPQPQASAFMEALHSAHSSSRENAAWALGVLKAPAETVLPLLKDVDVHVVQQALLSLARMPGHVPMESLQPLLAHDNPDIRGAAAVALAASGTDAAVAAVAEALQKEIAAEHTLYEDYIRRNRPKLKADEIERITGHYRCQMKLMQALGSVHSDAATRALEAQAFQHNDEFTQLDGIIAGFQLWDRLGANIQPEIQALASTDITIANRAEWTLIKAGPAVLPAVHAELRNPNADVRQRALHIVAWQGDITALPILHAMLADKSINAEDIAWAIAKIESLNPAQ